MSIRFPVKKGAAYFAGLDLPFFVGAADVAAAARDEGFSDVIVTERARAQFAFDPRKVPGYTDDWNAVFFGIYKGTRPTITVPARPSWFFEVAQQIPVPGKSVVARVVPMAAGEVVPDPPSFGGGKLALIAGGVAIWIWSTLEPVRGSG
jgi:hypothetical protein